MHDSRVVFAGEYVSCASHVRRELIYFVDSLDHITRDPLVPEIADDEFIRRRLGKLMPFEVDSANPNSPRP